MEKQLSQFSIVELKAAGYDEIQRLETAQNSLRSIIDSAQANLRAINNEILVRMQREKEGKTNNSIEFNEIKSTVLPKTP